MSAFPAGLKTVHTPINYTIGYGPYGAIPSQLKADYCFGPTALNVGWDLFNQYTTRWIFWAASTGARMSLWTEGFVPSDTNGSATDFFDGESLSYLAAAFDAVGKPIMATHDDAGTIRLQAVSNNVIVEYTWAGWSPRLIFTGGLVYDSNDLLIIVYYRDANGNLKFRNQIDEYGIEYSALTPTSPVRYITKAETNERMIQLWTVTMDSSRPLTRQQYFETDTYSPLPVLPVESMSVAHAISGTIEDATVPASGGTESMELSPFDMSGTIIEVIVTSSGTEYMEMAPFDMSGTVVDAIMFTSGTEYMDIDPFDLSGSLYDEMQVIAPFTEIVTMDTTIFGVVTNV